MPKEPASPELQALAEQVGSFIRYWGFKKVHGEIWVHLFLSAEPLDAGALMARLGISKALASMSLHDLLSYRVIFAAEKSPRGTQLYRANPDLMEAILGVLRSREKVMLGQIQSAFRAVKKQADGRKGASLNGAAVGQLGEFIGSAQDALGALLDFQTLNLSHWEKFAEAPSSSDRPLSG